MDQELKRLNGINTTLDIFVDTLDTELNQLKDSIKKQRFYIRQINLKITSFQNDVYQILQNILSQEKLKEGVTNLFKKYVNKELPKPIIDDELENEYKNQTTYLEKTV